MRMLLIQQDCIYCPIAMAALREIRIMHRIKPERDVQIINSNTNRGEYFRILNILRSTRPDISPDMLYSFPLLIYDKHVKVGITNQLAYQRVLYHLMVKEAT